MDNTHKKIIGFQEFIEYCGISKSKGYKALHTNELPYFKPSSGKVYLKMEDVDNWLLSNRVPAAHEIESQSKITV